MREVARLLVSATASTSSAGSASGLMRAAALETTRSTSSELGGEGRDGGAVADVEYATFDASHRRPADDRRRGRPDVRSGRGR